MLVVCLCFSDFLFCCTRQAERYRERLREICNEGAEVVGVSKMTTRPHIASVAWLGGKLEESNAVSSVGRL